MMYNRQGTDGGCWSNSANYVSCTIHGIADSAAIYCWTHLTRGIIIDDKTRHKTCSLLFLNVVCKMGSFISENSIKTNILILLLLLQKCILYIANATINSIKLLYIYILLLYIKIIYILYLYVTVLKRSNCPAYFPVQAY